MNCGVKYLGLVLLLVLSMCESSVLVSYLWLMVLKVVMNVLKLFLCSVSLVVMVWLLNFMISFGLCLCMVFSVLCRWKLGIEWFELLMMLLLLGVKVKIGWWNLFLICEVMMLIMFWCYVLL